MRPQPLTDPAASPQLARAVLGVDADEDAVKVCDTRTGLLDWQSSATRLAMWRRAFPADIVKALDELDVETLDGWRLKCDLKTLESDLGEAMSRCGIEEQGLRDYLKADMALLGQTFGVCTGARHVEMRLSIVTDDACRRFHTDSYPERLAVTYLGPGTVAVPGAFADEALREQADYEGPLVRIPRFWASLFAGKRSDRSGLVHRSPKIAGTGECRIFFCVNAASL